MSENTRPDPVDIKPELVELIAKAIYERLHHQGPDWEAVPPVWREVWLDDARTALEVAGPVIAAHALREAADAWGAGEWQEAWLADAVEDDVLAVRFTVTWLRARASRIEAGS